MRVAVFGAGAIGAYYGARLSEGGAEVGLIARGAHLAALRERGLTIVTLERTSEHRLLATDEPAEIGPVDVVLFCVKSYDTDTTSGRLGPRSAADLRVSIPGSLTQAWTALGRRNRSEHRAARTP